MAREQDIHTHCAELPLDLHDQAMEVLRTMRELIDELPLEWQIAVVKALTARTILKTYEQMRTTKVLTA